MSPIEVPPPPRSTKGEVRLAAAATAAVVLVAAALRLAWLTRLPPGLWFDEAVNGVDVRMILSGQGVPLYFAANLGREPFFIYLQALSVALFGFTPFSLRLVSAVSGLLAIAAVYYCARHLFCSPAGETAECGADRRATWIGILAAAVLATSYWHVSISRLGLRAVLLPLFSAVAMTFFWRGWALGRRGDFIASGAAFGLSLYTYSSARMLLIAPLAFVLAEGAAALWRRIRGRARPAGQAYATRLTGLGLALLAGALVCIPLVFEVVRHPEIVLGRTGDIMAGQWDSLSQELAANAVRVARAFYDRGDLNPRHNLPGRPATDLLTAALFTAGLVTAVFRAGKAHYRFVVIWLTVMLLPSVLSDQAPHYLRAAGALPPFALLAGAGGDSLARLAPQQMRRFILPGLVAGTLLLSGALTARDYFIRWPGEPRLAQEFSIPEQQAAEQAAVALGAPGTRAILLPQRLYAAPNLTFAVPLIRQDESIPDALLAKDRALRIGPAGPGAASGQPEWLVWRGGDGLHSAAIMQARDGELAPWSPEVSLNLHFAGGLRLAGYDVRPDVIPSPASSPTVTLTLYWKAASVADLAALTTTDVFAHLVAGGAVRADANGPLRFGYRLAWPALHGLIVDERQITLPPGLPLGKAYFEVGLTRRQPWEAYSEAERVSLLDGNGNVAGDLVRLAGITIGAAPPRADVHSLTSSGAVFEDRITLTGWELLPAHGNITAVSARLCWRAERRSPSDYTAFVHLLDPAGDIIAQFDGPPGGEGYGTSLWTPGETACSIHPLQLSPGATPDGLKLRVGLYEVVSGRQLQVAGDGAEPGATYLLFDLGSGPGGAPPVH